MKILITGGTGLVGNHLSKILKKKGYDVAILSREKNINANIKTYSWNVDKKEIDTEAIEKTDYIIHLAGAGIAEKRWSKKRKQLIIDSRIKSADFILSKIKENKIQLKAFISASAIGYYGAITSDKIFIETDVAATDFLGNTCSLWEQAVDRFDELGIRTVKIRTGIILSKEDGALAKMTIPVKMGIGSSIGSGKQFIPWIHIDDLCNIYVKAIEDNKLKGAYNAVAPEHITNRELTKALAFALNKPFYFPNVPALLIKLLFGKMADILLKGSRVSSEKITNSGFNFSFPNIKGAFENLFPKK